MATVMAQRVVHEMMPNIVFDNRVASKTLLPVAAYARVSTEKEEQEESFERQVEHYTNLIKSNSEWEFAGIYADPGISGTKAEKRPDFMRMIDDCRAGKIKRILVKSVSRFARNTVDALNYIRELKDLGVGISFESENIDTMSAGGEVLLTILAAMAEQESRTISSNVKWAYQRRFQKGEIILNHGLMLGYKKCGKDENNMDIFEINEEEAEIVRRIYREYHAGMSPHKIAERLTDEGIKTKLGKDKWRYGVIMSILTNEKYTGNAILGKTYKPDVMSKKRYTNTGQAPMYYAENTHPAIISKEMFDMVQEEIKARKHNSGEAVGNTKYTSKYPFSGLLICADCGSRLRRHVRTVGSGKKVPSWACTGRMKNGRDVCDSHHLREDTLHKTYIAAIKKLVSDYNEVIETIDESARMILGDQSMPSLSEIGNEIIEIQSKVLKAHKDKNKNIITEIEYTKQIELYSEELKKLEQKQQELQTTASKYALLQDWLKAFKDHMDDGRLTDVFDGVLVREMVEHVIVHSDKITVKFKSGITVEQEYVK